MGMEVEIRDLTDKKIRILIKKTNHVFMNMLRRIIISDVPKMAIHNVDFHHGSLGSSMEGEEEVEYESISPLFDEIIAHRLAMVPVTTDLEIFNKRNECTCGGEGCPSCTIMYALNKRGPCTVFSGDLEPVNNEAYRIKEDLIPLVKLDKAQALLIYATAELGSGRQHAKWQAAQAIGYQYLPKITIKKNISEDSEDCVNACPKGVLEWDKKKKTIKVVDLEACNLCNACVEAIENAPVEIDYDDTAFLFSFETDSSYTPEVVLKAAIDILNNKFNDFIEAVGKLS
jgi:DNA-directed RNA polymerase subunit D